MDRMYIKITSGFGLLSTAILLIPGRARVTRVPINPASISTGIVRFFQRVLEGVNFQLTNVAGFNSNWNLAALLLLSGDAITNANPVRIDLAGNGSNSNFPVNSSSRQPDVISKLSDIGYFRQRFT